MEQINSDQNNFTESPIFFPTAPHKLVIMSICTFGLYEIYWFYRNWKFLKYKKSLNISPFWRAWFSIIFCYSLFKNIKSYAEENGIKTTFSPGSLAIGFIIIFITWKLPDPGWIISTFTFIPLLTVQTTINNLNNIQLENVINKNFSGWNIFGIIISIILWGFVILAIFLPNK